MLLDPLAEAGLRIASARPLATEAPVALREIVISYCPGARATRSNAVASPPMPPPTIAIFLMSTPADIIHQTEVAKQATASAAVV